MWLYAEVMAPLPLPEVRTILERAWARRESLLGLIAQVPGDYWQRQAAGDAWSARQHLDHLATIDSVVGALLAAPRPVLDEILLRRRAEAMEAIAELPLSHALEALRTSREALVLAIAGMGPAALGGEVMLPARDAWSSPGSIPVRRYLAEWAEHDGLHEAAIREAIAVAPAPADLARAASTRRRS